MAQTGYTPIKIYASSTASAVPLAANLDNTNGAELAINIADGKLFYKDSGGTVKVIAGTGGTGVVAGSNTQVQFNNNGVFGASSNLTWDGSTLATTGFTASGTVTLSGGTANGVAYLNGSKVLTSGSALTFDGTNLGVGGATSFGGTYSVVQSGGASTSGYYLAKDSGGVIGQFAAEGVVVIGSRTNHDVKFTQNSNEGMRLTSTGLGIGTSSPGQKLVLAQSGATSVYQQFLNNSSSNVGYIGLTAGGDYVLQTNNAMAFYTGASYTERMRIDSSGNLGIGTSSPLARLDVQGGSIKVKGYTSPNNSDGYSLLSGVTGNIGYIQSYYGNGSAVVGAPLSFDASYFAWRNIDAGYAERMRLDSSGNLGIGTATPYSLLELNSGPNTSAIRISDNNHNGSASVFPYTVASYWARQSNVQGTGTNPLAVGGATAAIVFTDEPGNYTFETAVRSSSILLYTANNNNAGNVGVVPTERMRITSTGNVGIGTSSPFAKLAVSNAGASTIEFAPAFSGTANLIQSFNRSGAAYVDTVYEAAAHRFQISGTERMRLDSSGNLGLGTIAAAGQRFVIRTAAQTDAALVADNGVNTGFKVQFAANLTSIGNDFNNPLAFLTNNTERMRLDSSGNLGIGTTSPGTKLDVKQSGSNWYDGIRIVRSNSDNQRLVLGNTSGAGWIASVDAGGGTNNALLFGRSTDGTTFTESARFDPSGNFGIGTSSPSEKLEVTGNIAIINSGNPYMLVKTTGGGNNPAYKLQADTNYWEMLGIFSNSTDDLSFRYNGTTRFNMTSAGKATFDAGLPGDNAFSINNSSSTGYGISVGVYNNSSNTYRYFEGYDNTVTQRIAIYTNGDVKNTNNSYGALSDQKLKQDIVDAGSQWNDIKNLRVRKYRFKDKPEEALQIGLIAQEVELVSPGLVVETPDQTRDKDGKVTDTGEFTKTLKYSVLYMKAVKALQEAMDRIEQLEAKVAALETK